MSIPPSGITDRAQAILVALAYALTSLGTLTTVVGLIHNEQWQLIIGIVIIVGGIAAGAIKEGLGILVKPAK